MSDETKANIALALIIIIGTPLMVLAYFYLFHKVVGLVSWLWHVTG
jgi:hypothetical protein